MMKYLFMLSMVVKAVMVLLPTGMCQLQCPASGTISKIFMKQFSISRQEDIIMRDCDVSVREIQQDAFEDSSYIRTLTLSYNKLTNIPDRVFSKLVNLEQLYMGFNEIERISFHTFTGLQNLRRLSLRNNKLAQVHHDVFGNQSKLEYLNLGVNQISVISNQTFNGLNNLRDLILHSNKITRIPGGVFAQLSSLTYLHLAEYLISRISVLAFTGIRNLRSLRLFDNRISEIADNLFIELSQLNDLDLANNRISRISRHSFSGLNTSLTELNLQDNQISVIDKFAFHGLKNLVKLSLSHNSLAALDGNWFAFTSNLKELYFDNNSLQEITRKMFTNITNSIVRLGLSGNSIRYIEEGSLEVLNKLSTVCLQRNFLQTLPQDLQLAMVGSGLKDVSLGENPLHCNCELMPIKQWISKSTLCLDYKLITRVFTLDRLITDAYNLNCATPITITVPMSTLSNVTMICSEPILPIVSTTNNGNIMEIHCTTSGDPAPIISLQTPDGSFEFKPSRSKTTYQNSAVMEINLAGEYVCTATNIAGSKIKSVIITQSTTSAVTELLRSTALNEFVSTTKVNALMSTTTPTETDSTVTELIFTTSLNKRIETTAVNELMPTTAVSEPIQPTNTVNNLIPPLAASSSVCVLFIVFGSIFIIKKIRNSNAVTETQTNTGHISMPVSRQDSSEHGHSRSRTPASNQPYLNEATFNPETNGGTLRYANENISHVTETSVHRASGSETSRYVNYRSNPETNTYENDSSNTETNGATLRYENDSFDSETDDVIYHYIIESEYLN